MPIRCAASGCTNTKDNSGRIFVYCRRCNLWFCSKHGSAGNPCPPHGHRYLEGPRSSGGCFITTATLESIGKPDNCEELNVFRNFRDNWLLKQEGGKELIEEYYKIAPKIVSSINFKKDRNRIYNSLWKESIEPCFKLIKDNSFEEAKTIYCNLIVELKKMFLHN